MPGIFDSVSGWLRDRFRGGRVVTPRTETAREAAFNERLLNLLDEDAPETRAAATSINQYTRDRIREDREARQYQLPDLIPDTELAVPPATLEDFINPALGVPHSAGPTGWTGPLPAWQPCTCCDGFWCSIHDQHTHDCPCPPIEEWDMDPYTVSVMPSSAITDHLRYSDVVPLSRAALEMLNQYVQRMLQLPEYRGLIPPDAALLSREVRLALNELVIRLTLNDLVIPNLGSTRTNAAVAVVHNWFRNYALSVRPLSGMYTTDDDAPGEDDDEAAEVAGQTIEVGTPGIPGIPGPPAVSESVMAALTASIIARMQPITNGVIDGDVQERQRLRVLQELQAALVDLGVAAPLPAAAVMPRPTGIVGENPRTVTVVDGRTISWTEATAPVIRWYLDGRVANHVDFWSERTTTGDLGEASYWVSTFWYTLLFSTDAPDYRAFINYSLRSVFNDLILEMDEDVLFGLQVIMRARVDTWSTTRANNWLTLTHAQMFLTQLDRVFGDDTPVRPMGAADAMQALESESAQYDFHRDWPIRPVPLPTVNDLPPIDPSEGRNHRAIDS